MPDAAGSWILSVSGCRAERRFDDRGGIPPDLDEAEPGPISGVSLASIDVDRPSGRDRLAVLRVHQRTASRYPAQVYRDMASAVDAVADHDPDEPLDAAIPGEAAAAEIRVARRVAEEQGDARWRSTATDPTPPASSAGDPPPSDTAPSQPPTHLRLPRPRACPPPPATSPTTPPSRRKARPTSTSSPPPPPRPTAPDTNTAGATSPSPTASTDRPAPSDR